MVIWSGGYGEVTAAILAYARDARSGPSFASPRQANSGTGAEPSAVPGLPILRPGAPTRQSAPIDRGGKLGQGGRPGAWALGLGLALPPCPWVFFSPPPVLVALILRVHVVLLLPCCMGLQLHLLDSSRHGLLHSAT